MSFSRHQQRACVGLLTGCAALMACGPTDGGGPGPDPLTHRDAGVDAGVMTSSSSMGATSGQVHHSSSVAPPSSSNATSASVGSSTSLYASSAAVESSSATSFVASSSAASLGGRSSSNPDSSGSSSAVCIAQVECLGTCGVVTGVCGVTVDCGGCPWPQVCGAETPNVCGGGVTTLAFLETGRVGVGQDPRALAWMGRDGVGSAQFMTANTGSQDVSSVVVGADGTASNGVLRALPGSPVALAASNVVGDDALDLLVVAWGAGALAVWDAPLSDHAVALEPVVVAAAPRAVAVGDLDGNAISDVVLVHDNGMVNVVWDFGRASQHTQVMQEPGRLAGVAVGDVNADGFPDVVVASVDFDALLVFPGGSNGLGDVVRVPVLYAPERVVLEDVDGDGRLDLVVGHPSSGMVVLYAALAAGGFGDPQVLMDSGEPVAFVLADLDADGALDLAAAGSDGFVHLLAPALTPVRTLRVWAGSAPVAVAAVDVNGDTALDLVVLNQVGADVAVLLNQSF